MKYAQKVYKIYFFYIKNISKLIYIFIYKRVKLCITYIYIYIYKKICIYIKKNYILEPIYKYIKKIYKNIFFYINIYK